MLGPRKKTVCDYIRELKEEVAELRDKIEDEYDDDDDDDYY